MTQISERLLVQAHLAAKQPKPLTAEEEAFYRSEIAAELKKQNAVLVAHYYCDPVIQALAEETGGRTRLRSAAGRRTCARAAGAA